MAVPTTAPLKRGIVRRLRSSTPLISQLKGGIHQRIAPRRTRYPFIKYAQVSAPWSFDAGGEGNDGHATVDALYDISVLSLNPIQAETLDAIIQDLFSSRTADIDLNAVVDGLNVQRCHRVADLPTGPERDGEGRRIVEIGGTYRIVADAALVIPGP